MTTITQVITALPAGPNPATDTRENFSTKAAARVLAEETMVTQINTVASQMNTVAGEVNTNAGTASSAASTATTQAALATTNGAAQVTLAAAQVALATTQANAAANSATAAAVTAGAAAWISGHTYVLNDAAISQVDFHTYRHKTASSSSATDPASDATNWTMISGDTAQSEGSLVHASGNKTTPVDADEAAFSDSAAGNILVRITWANIKATLIATALSWTGQQTFKETKDTTYAITDGAAFEIDPVNGNIQTIALGANRTPAATNFEAGQGVLLGIDDGTAYSITWTTVNPTWVKPGGTASAPTLATTGYTWVLLWKVGSTMYAAEVGKP
jgi:hypothetical protein